MEATLTYTLDVQSGKKVSGDEKSSQGVQKDIGCFYNVLN